MPDESLCSLYKETLNTIEAEAVDLAQQGCNVMLHATKASQASLVFLMPILDRLASIDPPEASSTRTCLMPESLVLVSTPGLAAQWIAVAEQLAEALPEPIEVGGVMNETSLAGKKPRLVVASPVSLLPRIADGSVNLDQLSMAAVAEADVLMSNHKYESVNAQAAKAVLSSQPPGGKVQLLMAMTAELAEHEFAVEMSHEHHRKAETARSGGGCCKGAC